jgi:hypothetical protein
VHKGVGDGCPFRALHATHHVRARVDVELGCCVEYFAFGAVSFGGPRIGVFPPAVVPVLALVVQVRIGPGGDMQIPVAVAEACVQVGTDVVRLGDSFVRSLVAAWSPAGRLLISSGMVGLRIAQAPTAQPGRDRLRGA